MRVRGKDVKYRRVMLAKYTSYWVQIILYAGLRYVTLWIPDTRRGFLMKLVKSPTGEKRKYITGQINNLNKIRDKFWPRSIQ